MIGITTFHNNYNFGAALQCASLNEVIRSRGHSVETIDYSPYNVQRSMLRGWGLRKYGASKALKKRWVDLKSGAQTERNFSRFRDRYYSFSSHCESSEDVSRIAPNYSHIITGSDQVWRFDRPSPYFLHFGKDYHGFKASYAPCCTSREQPDFQISQVRQWINELDLVSVRNQFSYDLVSDLCGREAEIVADPTLLIDLESDESEIDRLNLPENYLLTYVLGDEPQGGMHRIIQRAQAVHGSLPVVAIRLTLDGYHELGWADRILDGMGPFEWVELIKRSSFFITDSFHGVIFAMKHRRPFFGYYSQEWRSPRMVDLRERYQLGQRLTHCPDDFDDDFFQSGISHETTEALRKHQQLSLAYLDRILSLK